MAAVNCNYSGEPVYTKWYDNSSRGYLDITGVSYETTNGSMENKERVMQLGADQFIDYASFFTV